MTEKIYLDNNSTTKIDSKVLAAVLQELEGVPANASSVHFFGQKAKKTLQKSREVIANYLGVHFDEVIFTSGATEALNMCIKGLLPKGRKGKILSTSLEHACIHETLLSLEKEGYTLELLPCPSGKATPIQIEEALKDDQILLIVLSAVNSETGIMTDITSIAAIADKAKIPLVVDGVALIGKELFCPIPRGITAMCFSGHKFHAPKGSGIAVLRETFPFTPLIYGGHQEFGKRAGTENIPAIIGIKTAIELIAENPSLFDKIRTFRDYFEAKLLSALPHLLIHGHKEKRVSNTSNIAFPPIRADHFLLCLDQKGLAASHGSACSSGSIEPSRVLLNMGIDRQIVQSSLRFSLSRHTTFEEIEKAIELIVSIYHELSDCK